jgi:hypothetical protein
VEFQQVPQCNVFVPVNLDDGAGGESSKACDYYYLALSLILSLTQLDKVPGALLCCTVCPLRFILSAARY